MKNILIFFFLLISPILSATNYYVKNGGNNALSGQDDANAWATIAYVNGRTFSPDDIISFKCGSTWTEALQLAPPSSGTAGHPIIFNSYSTGVAPIIKPSLGRCMYIDGKSYLQFVGLIFDGILSTSGYYDGIKIVGASSYITFSYCTIRDANKSGMYYGVDTDHITISHCIVARPGRVDDDPGNKPHGIYGTSHDNVIEYSEFYGSAHYGIHIYNGYDYTADDNIVRYNYCHDNYAAGIIISCGSRNQVYYNISTNSDDWVGIWMADAPYTEVYNNTFYGNAYQGIYISSNSPNCTVKNNIIYSNGGTIYDGAAGTTLSNNLTTNPLFLNAGGSYLLDTDFKISSSSPAKDAGTNVSLTEDYFGVTVPYNAVQDIGANEYEVPGAVVGPVVIYTTSVYTSVLYATVGGNVTDDGGGTVTARGICWGATANPTTAGSKTTNGTGTGTFIATLTPLTASTTYHARAYATNSAGTAYGADVTFITSATGRKRYVIFSGS